MHPIAFLLALLCASLLSAQSSRWQIDPFDDRYFIENLGQYPSPVLAGVDVRGMEVYFDRSGMLFQHVLESRSEAFVVAAEDDEPDNAAEDRTRRILDTMQLRGVWRGANPGSVTLKDVQTQRFHFAHDGGQIANARGFKGLEYKDLYPGIDLRYEFHATEGLKYAITVHPGADAAAIVMDYRLGLGLTLDHADNLHVQAANGELIDHAPQAYLMESGDPVGIRFKVAGNSVSFEIDPYDHNQTLFIDPWLIAPGFTSDTKVFDVSWDCSGNVYAFGGRLPWKVKKFNAAGVLQWTYNTAHNDWYGDLVSDDLGNVYIVEGCCNGNRQKLNSSGVVQWTVINGVYEFWRLTYSCDWSRLTMATAYSGGGVTPFQSLSTVNTTSGAVTGGTAVSSSEPRSVIPSVSGNYYVLTAVGNEVIARNNAYGAIYNVGSGYSLLYNGPLYSNGTNTTQGQNGLALYGGFIFTTNGATLMKRDQATGALVTSVAIPGGVAEQNSGVTVDNCGDVFVGTNASVRRYDANLNFVSSYAVSGAVYDVTVSGTAQVLSGGLNFLSSEVSPCVAPCPTCIILPEGLLRWDVQLNAAEQVELAWEVGSAEDIQEFRIQRSGDGQHFEDWRTVVGGQQMNEMIDPQPIPGLSWYRLQSVGRDGGMVLSPARAVEWMPDGATLSVWPNPAEEELNLVLTGFEGQAGILEVVDVRGAVVQTLAVDGEVFAWRMDLEGLAEGIYTVRLVGGDAAAVRFCRVGR
ncbi:MAG: hypothetical protein U0176_26850 [Bacteroidia bacterium]